MLLFVQLGEVVEISWYFFLLAARGVVELGCRSSAEAFVNCV